MEVFVAASVSEWTEQPLTHARSHVCSGNSNRFLPPRQRHRGFFAMPIFAAIFGTGLEPGDEPRELFHRFAVGRLAFLGARLLGVAEDAGVAVAARPGDDRRGARAEKIDPVEGAGFVVEADRVALDLV